MVGATGIGSGLDVNALVNRLVQAQRAPAEKRLLQRDTRLTGQLSAFSTLQGALSRLRSSIKTLADPNTFKQRSAQSSDTEALSVKAGAAAAPGDFKVSVQRLATAQSLASGRFDKPTDTLGEGRLTIRFGTLRVSSPDAAVQTVEGFSVNPDRSTATLSIDRRNNTLEGVRDTINQADIGVSAAIVKEGEGVRLLLSARQTGAANAVEIQVSDQDGNDTDTQGLSRLAFNTRAANLSQSAQGQDARFSVNGLSLTSAGNTVENVVDGVELTLRKTTQSPVAVTVSNNADAVRSAVEDFVQAFNSFARVSDKLTEYNPQSKKAGALQGDFSARSIINRVRSALGRAAEGATGALRSLAELGITTQADGSLAIDKNRLDAALQDNFDDVAGVFARVGASTDANIRFKSAGEATQPGRFTLEITRLATRGRLEGAAIAAPSAASPRVIDERNDNFRISVNGVASGEIALTRGRYSSGAALAAEIQARINGDRALSRAGVAVQVGFTADNRLRITSERFGSSSQVEIDALDAGVTATLGLSRGAGTAGRDVAGRIGAIAATGRGQTLSGAVGSPAEGVVVEVSGGALGARGAVNVSTGVAVGLNGVLDGLLNARGLIDLRTDGLQSSAERLKEDRADLDTRMKALETRLRADFNALDTLLSRLRSTSDFLRTQLAAIPVPGTGSRGGRT